MDRGFFLNGEWQMRTSADRFDIQNPATGEAEGSTLMADGAVVGSAIVSQIAEGQSVDDVLAFVKSLADGAHEPG